MKHEGLSEGVLRDKVLIGFSGIIAAACHAGPVRVISSALKTGAPNHMIDAQLPNLWRY
jgi:hydroxylamine reductase (hybrid-cluster protein)